MRAQYVPENTFRVAGTRGILERLLAREREKRDRRTAVGRGERLGEALGGFDVRALAVESTREAFAKLPGFRLATGPAIDGPEALQSAGPAARQAVIAYEYAVHASYTNVFVGCTLSVGGTDADPAARWSGGGSRYNGFSYAMVETAGLPKDKAARQEAYAANGAARLKNDLARAFATCARVAVRQAGFDASEVAALRAGPKVTLTTATNQQEQGWLVEGRENLEGGSYGALGIGKTFVRPGTPGALLLSAGGHLYHLSSSPLEAPR